MPVKSHHIVSRTFPCNPRSPPLIVVVARFVSFVVPVSAVEEAPVASYAPSTIGALKMEVPPYVEVAPTVSVPLVPRFVEETEPNVLCPALDCKVPPIVILPEDEAAVKVSLLVKSILEPEALVNFKVGNNPYPEAVMLVVEALVTNKALYRFPVFPKLDPPVVFGKSAVASRPSSLAELM